MSLIDTRTVVGLRQVCQVLLRIAENPLTSVDHVQESRLSILNDECIVASQLARQASAAVISNCVVELWSRTVACLHSLEPDFPLYPSSVAKFVAETRLPFLSYVSLYYSPCGKPFEGTSSGEKVKTLVDLRHELQHDKPETRAECSKERVDKVLKWKKRLESLVGKEPLLWLPRVRASHECIGFHLQGEPPVMKFMKYPVAKWAMQATVEVTEEMTTMLFDYKGTKKLWSEKPVEEMVDARFGSEEDLRRLWQAGE
jgi:hypothetical protein